MKDANQFIGDLLVDVEQFTKQDGTSTVLVPLAL